MHIIVNGIEVWQLEVVNSTTPLYDDYMQYDYTVTENFPSMFVNEVSGGHAPFGKTFVSHLQWQQLHGWYVTLAHMYYNFCDYNQGLGWMHSIWLGWRASDVNSSFKPVDSQVIPLWYIMGKGKRIYTAEIATDVRQIEAEMPDGVPTVIVASVSPWPVSGPVSVIPQNLTDGHYWAEITIDTCQTQVRRRLFINTTTNAIQISDLPPFSISVLKFKKVIADSNSDYDNAILDFGKAAQGAYGWSYGVYNPTLQVFTEAASWQTTTKEWTSGLARIGQKNMVVPDNQNWVTRLWCSDVDGQVSISGNAALSSGSTDGCVLRILRNNNGIWSKHFGPGEEISYNLPYQNVLQDDKIMFCIDSGSSMVWPWQSTSDGQEGIRNMVTEDGAIKRREILDQYHIVSDVAFACFRYKQISGDEKFFSESLSSIMVESLRFWRSFIFKQNHR